MREFWGVVRLVDSGLCIYGVYGAWVKWLVDVCRGVFGLGLTCLYKWYGRFQNVMHSHFVILANFKDVNLV
jgi:hypothetical protein